MPMGQLFLSDIIAKLEAAFTREQLGLEAGVDCYQGMIRVPPDPDKRRAAVTVHFSAALKLVGEHAVGLLWEYNGSDLLVPVESHAFYSDGSKRPEDLVMRNIFPVATYFPAYMILNSGTEGFVFASRLSHEGQSVAQAEHFPAADYSHRLNNRSVNLLHGLRQAQKRNTSWSAR